MWAMRAGIRARPWVFSADPGAPAVREALGARRSCHHRPRRRTSPCSPTTPAPGPPRAGRRPADDAGGPVAPQRAQRPRGGVGRPRASASTATPSSRGCARSAPDDVLNPGRMNTYTLPVERWATSPSSSTSRTTRPGSRRSSTSARGLCAPGGRLHLALGTGGDRTDEILRSLGEIAGLRADHVVAAHKEHYLRGRTTTDLEAQLRIGPGPRRGRRRGVLPHRARRPARPSSREPATATSWRVMCHAEREEIVAWLRGRGGVADDPDGIRRKVVRARGEHESEDGDRRPLGRRGCRRARRARQRRCVPPTRATPASPTSWRGPTTARARRRRRSRSTRRRSPSACASRTATGRRCSSRRACATSGGWPRRPRSSTRPSRGTRTASGSRPSGPSCTTTPTGPTPALAALLGHPRGDEHGPGRRALPAGARGLRGRAGALTGRRHDGRG